MSIVTAIVILFPLHWILIYTFYNFITPYPELPERLLTPFIFSLTFILTGSLIAPKYKFYTTVFLFSISMILSSILIWVLLNNLMWFGSNLEMQYGGVPFYLSIVGSFIGLYVVSKKFKDFDTDSNSLFKEIVVNIITSLIFIFCIYNPTFRFIIFILILIMGLYQMISSFKERLYNTIKMKFKLLYDLIFIIALLIGLVNKNAGMKVSFICLVLTIFGYIWSIIVHIKKVRTNNLS
jgi:hypothetical protein